MKTVLDLLKRFDRLNEAKIAEGGELPPEDEERWQELKVVYDLLMFHSGIAQEASGAPFSPAEIRECLSDATRLRVPIDAHAMIHHDDKSFDAQVVNVSRGGVFLASDTLADAGSRLTIYMAGMDEDDSGEMLELDGEVVWCAAEGIPDARIHRGMGVRFVDLSDETGDQLETLVVKSIEKRLAGLRR